VKFKLSQIWQLSQFRKSLSVLPASDRRKIYLVVLLQMSMGLLDLLGVALIGILGALTVTGVQSGNSGSRIDSLLKLIHLENLTFQQQAAILGILACIFLVAKTIFSIVFNRKILYFLSRRGAIISTQLISRVLSLPLLRINNLSTQSYVFAITNGVNAITLGVIGASVILIADLSLLAVMSVGLFIVNPVIAIASLLIFGIVGALVFKLIHERVRYLGEYETSLAIQTNSKIVEVLSTYRESVVRNRRDFYARQIGELRWKMADTLAELTFMPNISKYVIESTLVISALLICAIEFSIQDAKHAIASLAIFMAAGTRIAPAILRIQQGALQIKGSLGAASPTLKLLDDLQTISVMVEVSDDMQLDHSEFVSDVVLQDVALKYPGSDALALSNINFSIHPGQTIAIVGASGAGKTTLVDVILGVIEPNSGLVKISSMKPSTTISKWPGAIGYVPQDVVIIDGTIKENVCLGFEAEKIEDSLVNKALKDAQLLDFVRGLPEGLQTKVGERGSKISGGQRQRLGIARALLTRPKLLILDEATSALDAETESNFSDVLSNLQGQVTVITIAHRLATVRQANQVFYMDNGKILAKGTFEEICKQIPNFNAQAKLLEL